MKFKVGFKFFTGVICATMLSCSQVLAATKIDIGVSPSRLVDEVIEKGRSKTYKINVANRVVDVGDDFKVTFNVKGYLEDEYGDIVETEIISIEDNNFTLGSNTLKAVDVKFDVPEDFESGNYIARIDFEQEDEDGFFGNQINVLSVPIYVFIGDIDEYNSRVRDFSIEDSGLYTKDGATTVWKEVYTNILGVINPFKTVNTLEGIINKPLYRFNVKGVDVLDYNYNLLTNMKNCSTTEKVTNRKYIAYNTEDENINLKRVVQGANGLKVELVNGSVVEINLDSSIVSDVLEQVSNISKANKDITLGGLMDALLVPKYKGIGKSAVSLGLGIKNTGNTSTVIKGEYDVLKNNQTSILKGAINSPAILSGKVENFNTMVSDSTLEKGSYIINCTLTNKIKTKDISVPFKVEAVRYKVVIWLCILAVIFYILIITLGVLLEKYISKRLKSKNEEGKTKYISTNSINSKDV